ncbi:sensor histidine kinase [Vibrio paucivorans]|uniref:C4-dicarboxylate transport sensor protein DctB n=1 Tax=Vibrio paucivorans TaxID=2829489 RepID=A0A9X3CDN0_9VIBR|nr:ATP-binding protein [Vibrio paucivorans]MCW8333889.1 ATP-binding protein [Vibrio paucivorans]
MLIRRINLLFLLSFTFISVIGAHLVWDNHYQQVRTEHQAQLDRFADHISSKLDKYAHIPRLLSKDTELIDALRSPDNPAQIDITNRYLEKVNSVIQAADSYLIDREGNTIASSNWNISRSFIGRNFAWRPYFQQAIEGNESQYFALGSTSGLRGYYYSYPVEYAAEIMGVVVVKMDLSAIEENWKSKQSYFVATDPNNVIFMSSKPEWLFKSLSTLTNAQRNEVLNSRQYLDTNIRSLGLTGDLSQPYSELQNPFKGWIKGDFLVSSRKLDLLPLDIRVLSPKIALFWRVFGFVVILGLVFTIFYLAFLLMYHRRQKHRQLERIQSEAKQKLEFLVMERTAELHAEIDERSRTEQVLRQTQDELIQAAKLAVLGQMSASISHELNNPLAAIRSFADNGRRFLSIEKYERVDDNLERISSLTERIAKISEQLKSFARKSDSQDTQVTQVDSIIRYSHELMAAQLKSNMVTLEIQLASSSPVIEINPIQMEQVLINLITNAIQAMDGQDNKRIELTTKECDGQLIISISDNGPGIERDKIPHLFEPFYTTKKNGLGLGLSISQQILLAMGGHMEVSTSDLDGACFSISLPIYTQG